MKPYVKQVIDQHSYTCETRRKKQSKIRKSSGDRRGTKSMVRLAARMACFNEI